MKHIAIIGAGQLGSRHMQALNNVDIPLNIYVIDPSENSLNTAKVRFEESVGAYQHSVQFLKEIDCDRDLDLVVIASTSSHRRSIIEKLLVAINVKNLILEKLLFDRLEDYAVIEELLSSRGVKTWVNCPMRQMPFYQSLKSTFETQPIRFNVTGSQYGLVTNAIHYLDYVSYLTGDNEFSLDLIDLDNQVIESKRPGFFELTGSLTARYKNGSVAQLHCDNKGTAPVQIEIYNSESRVISREWEQQAWVTGAKTEWQWQQKSAVIPFQSQLTTTLVKSIFEKGVCDLPDFNSSVKTHLQLLSPLTEILAQRGIQTEAEFPFT